MTATTTIDDLVAAAFREPHPESELRGMVRALLATGYDRDRLVRDLNRCRLENENAGREPEASALFDLLDALAGWSAPELEL